MLSVSELGKSYGAQTLFEDVSLQFNAGCRYGLVGANGSGKSTFLRILAGEEEASEGTVSLPKRVTLGVLRQDHFRYENDRILDVVMMGNSDLWEAMSEKEKMLAGDHASFDANRYAELEETILRHQGYSMESRAGEILEGLGIPTESHERPLSTLSGGFKLRVLLAQVLAGEPDVLLLDEPTNHLDILSIRWLEKFLTEFRGCALVVSHDHRFLDNVTTHVADVDYETITLYPGNYSAFSVAKVEDRERKELAIARQEDEVARHKAFVDRFRAKATKARQAQSKLKLIERITIEDLPRSSRRWPVFRFEQKRPSGREALRIRGVSKAFGEKRVLTDVSFTVGRGDRLAIIGPNGIGKSTLLKIAIGDLPTDGGRVEWGYETHPGYFAQDHRAMLGDSKETVESWLWNFCPGEPIGFVRGKLGMVLFSGDDVEKRVTSLSGGEAARLIFARLGILQPNVLVLDEPTNHLDLESIEALVEGLGNYAGTLVFVSHDRWLVSKLASRILEITPSGLRDFTGTYEEYLERCGDDHLDTAAVLSRARREKREARAKEASPATPTPTKPANAQLSKKRRASLEAGRERTAKLIEEAEARVKEIEARFADPEFYRRTPPPDVKRLAAEQKTLASRIAELMKDWEQTEEELGRKG